MIFGKTTTQHTEDQQNLYAELYKHRIQSFALLPKELNDGSFVWLQTVYKDYNVYKDTYHIYQRSTNFEGKAYISYHLEDKQ